MIDVSNTVHRLQNNICLIFWITLLWNALLFLYVFVSVSHQQAETIKSYVWCDFKTDKCIEWFYTAVFTLASFLLKLLFFSSMFCYVSRFSELELKIWIFYEGSVLSRFLKYKWQQLIRLAIMVHSMRKFWKVDFVRVSLYNLLSQNVSLRKHDQSSTNIVQPDTSRSNVE